MTRISADFCFYQRSAETLLTNIRCFGYNLCAPKISRRRKGSWRISQGTWKKLYWIAARLFRLCSSRDRGKQAKRRCLKCLRSVKVSAAVTFRWMISICGIWQRMIRSCFCSFTDLPLSSTKCSTHRNFSLTLRSMWTSTIRRARSG